jgi:hypothetical protein
MLQGKLTTKGCCRLKVVNSNTCNFGAFARALVPRNYYSQSRKDGAVTLVVDQKFFSRNRALRGRDALNGSRETLWFIPCMLTLQLD